MQTIHRPSGRQFLGVKRKYPLTMYEEQETIPALEAAQRFYAHQFETLLLGVVHLPQVDAIRPKRERHGLAIILLSSLLAFSIVAIVTMLVLLKYLYFLP